MSGVLDSATAILGMSERRIALVSENISNAQTPGYKRAVGFSSVLAATGQLTAEPSFATTTDLRQGKLVETRNPFDLAIGGRGFFQLRAGDAIVYSREGQFHRAADGTLVTPRGEVLQQVGGGDLLVDNAMITIGPDGTVMDGDHANGAVAVFDTASPDAMRPLGGGRFTAPAGAMAEVDPPAIHQGMIEASNVETSDEMVEMMAALQHAQSGARLVQVYDELMGEALTSLGRDNR
jgi:flagellar basal-body rod protein FlgG